MKTASILSAALGLWLLLGLSEAARPADPDKPGAENEQCADDEIDMGEYCMKLVPAEPEPPGAPKATPFRKESMMPGVVRRNGIKPSPQAAEQPAPKPEVVVRHAIPSPVVAEGGFGIQTGVWSKRESAEAISKRILNTVSGVMLAPIPRGDSVLWASLAGPYASEDAAQEDLELLRTDPQFRQAWVKPLKGMKLEAIDYKPTDTQPE